MKTETKRAAIGLATAVIFNALLTIFAPVWYGLFDSIPLRLTAFFSFQVMFAAIAVVCHCVVEKQALRSLGIFREKPLLQIAWGFALFVAASVLFIALPVLFGQELKDMVPQKDNLLFAIPYKLIFVGFAEELLFRGYFLNSFKRLTDSKFASVMLSSLLFGLFHIILSGSIFQVVITAVIGIIFALPRTYKKSCSIVSVSLAHGLYGALLNTLSWAV